MIENLGELIRYHRIKQNIKQEDLASAIFCSRQYISHVENGKRPLSEQYILPLSKILKFNFNKYVTNSYKYKTIEHYLISQDFIDAINNFSCDRLEELLQNVVVIENFNYGTPYILKEYSRALVLKCTYNKIEKAEKTILNLLKIESRKDIINYIPTLHDEERYYSSIVLLSSILHLQNELHIAGELIKNTIDFIEYYYINDSQYDQSVDIFFRKLHIALLNNYADILFNQEQYDKSLVFVNRAFEVISKYDILYILDFILQLKVEILYKLDRIEEAQDIFLDFKYACKIKNKQDYFNTISQSFKETYPLLNIEK